MPMVIDEDRARRKAALEQKRAARKAAKAQEDAAAQATTTVAQAAPIITGICHLGRLPEESVAHIFKFMTAAEIGNLCLTGKLAQKLLEQLQIPLVGSRVPWSIPESMLQQLVEDAFPETTDRVITHQKRYQKLQKLNQLLGLAQFLQEGLLQYRHLPRLHHQRLPSFTAGRFASCSPEHSLCRVGSSVGLASWGVGRRGQLGHGVRQDNIDPKRLHWGIGYSLKIVQVAAGGGLVRVAHSLLLTSTGRVLSFGTGQYGALGHGYSAAKQLPDMLQPTFIESLHNIVQVAAGELHSACINSDGDVYTWGDGFCGQLGHADKRPQLSPKQVVEGALADECVAQVSCGSRHTVVVTEEGECFSWGLGHFGVLGRSFSPFEYDADAAVVALDGERVVAPVVAPVVAAPRDEAAELAAHLDLIANMTLDDASDQCIPKLVDSLQEVKMVGVSAGHRHTLFLDAYGHVYSCGSGLSGCLGHGNTHSQMVPCMIPNVQDVIQLSAGVDMSMAVDTSGSVYAWGKTDGGRIGLETTAASVPTRIPSIPPALDVECGYVHSLIVLRDGSILQCGRVGVDGARDGESGPPQALGLNVWHRLHEPSVAPVKKERWKKYGKYEVKGRSKMMNETE